MNSFDWRRLTDGLARIAWVVFFISLPVTSFPFFPPGIGGRTLVRPLAIYPLAILLLVLTIPRLIRRPLPRTFLPLLAFALIALISSMFAFTSDLDAFRGVTPVSRLIRNLITLGLGISFYFTTVLLHESWDDLKFSLRWLYAGMGLALLWGSLQIPIVIRYHPLYYRIANTLQQFVSTRKLFTSRISGLTFEPKWFAEQICFLLLPWLIASVLEDRSVFPWRWRRLTVEWGLLGWAVVVLIFTFSRTGIFLLALLAVVGFALYHRQVHKTSPASHKSVRRRILEVFSVVLIVMAVVFVAGSQNAYFSRLWRYWTEARSRNRSYLEFIAVEQRFVYWVTALHTFENAPWLGVGLGNYAFYFDDSLPNQPWNTNKEIVRQITPEAGRDRLITPKNLVARLISETGVFGTGSFLFFILAVAGCAVYLWFSNHSEQKFWGLAAFLALIVFAFLVFSFDSFALPNMWVVFGLITAAAHLPNPFPEAGFSQPDKTAPAAALSASSAAPIGNGPTLSHIISMEEPS